MKIQIEKDEGDKVYLPKRVGSSNPYSGEKKVYREG